MVVEVLRVVCSIWSQDIWVLNPIFGFESKLFNMGRLFDVLVPGVLHLENRIIAVLFEQRIKSKAEDIILRGSSPSFVMKCVTSSLGVGSTLSK